MDLKSVTKSITSDNTWTVPIHPNRQLNTATHGHLAISIMTTSSTVTIQRSFDDGASWDDVDEFSSSIETDLFDPTNDVIYRIGIASGDYGTDNVEVGLYQ